MIPGIQYGLPVKLVWASGEMPIFPTVDNFRPVWASGETVWASGEKTGWLVWASGETVWASGEMFVYEKRLSRESIKSLNVLREDILEANAPSALWITEKDTATAKTQRGGQFGTN